MILIPVKVYFSFGKVVNPFYNVNLDNKTVTHDWVKLKLCAHGSFEEPTETRGKGSNCPL